MTVPKFLSGLIIAFGLLISITWVSQNIFAESRHSGVHAQGKPKRLSFTELDTNKDGKVSLAEFKAPHEKRMTARFQKMDANNDGSLSEDEFGKKGGFSFEKLDADGDGKITKKEFEAHREKMKKKRKSQ